MTFRNPPSWFYTFGNITVKIVENSKCETMQRLPFGFKLHHRGIFGAVMLRSGTHLKIVSYRTAI